MRPILHDALNLFLSDKAIYKTDYKLLGDESDCWPNCWVSSSPTIEPVLALVVSVAGLNFDKWRVGMFKTNITYITGLSEDAFHHMILPITTWYKHICNIQSVSCRLKCCIFWNLLRYSDGNIFWMEPNFNIVQFVKKINGAFLSSKSCY